MLMYKFMWKMVPVTTRLLSPQKSTSLSPLSFLSPTPWLPIMFSYPSLSSPTLAFKSPITRSMSCL